MVSTVNFTILCLLISALLPRILPYEVVLVVGLVSLFASNAKFRMSLIPSVVFLYLLIISIFHILSFYENRNWWNIFYTIYWVYFAFFLCLFTEKYREKVFMCFRKLFSSIMKFNILMLCISFIPPVQHIFWATDGRFLGLSYNPNYYAVHLMTFLLIYFFDKFYLSKSIDTKNNRWTKDCWFILISVSIIIFFCASRAVGVSLVVFYCSLIFTRGFGQWTKLQFNFVMFLFSLFALMIFILFFFNVITIGERTKQVFAITTSNRWPIWMMVVETFQKHSDIWLTGSGVGGIFLLNTAAIVWPHNTILSVIFDYGFVGFFVIFSIIWLPVHTLGLRYFWLFFIPLLALIVGNDIGYSPVLWVYVFIVFNSIKKIKFEKSKLQDSSKSGNLTEMFV